MYYFFLIFDLFFIFFWWRTKETLNTEENWSKRIEKWPHTTNFTDREENSTLKAFQSNHKWCVRQKAKEKKSNALGRNVTTNLKSIMFSCAAQGGFRGFMNIEQCFVPEHTINMPTTHTYRKIQSQTIFHIFHSYSLMMKCGTLL